MKCKDINAGKLTRKIDLLRREETPDNMGGFTDNWIIDCTLYAMVRPVSGRERAYAGRTDAQVDFRVVVRFMGDENGWPKITADNRVTFQGKTFGIEYVLDIEDKRQWLELGVREAK